VAKSTELSEKPLQSVETILVRNTMAPEGIDVLSNHSMMAYDDVVALPDD
jgi:hypothetical protein